MNAERRAAGIAEPLGGPGSGGEASPVARGGHIRRFIVRPETGGLASAIFAFLFFAIVGRTSGFLTVRGLASWLNVSADLGIIAVPVGLLMIAGEFDLSVGSVVGSTSVAIALCSGFYHLSPWVGIGISILVGLLVGLINGIMVVVTKLPSFIVTLATLLMVYGGSLAVSDGLSQSSSTSVTITGFTSSLFVGTWDNFYVSIIWWIAVVAIAAYILQWTRFGNWVFAVGGSYEAARNCGVRTAYVKIVLYICSALGAVLAGIILTLTDSTGAPSLGSTYNLTAIAAVVIGGVLLTGGYGSAVGTLFGTLTYGIVSLGVFYLGWDADLYSLFIGALLLVTVLGNNYLRRLAAVRS